MRILTRVLLLLAVGLIGTLAFVLTTESGLKLVWRQVEPLLPAGLEIESVDGRLLGPINIKGLVFSNDSLRLSLTQAQAEWSPLELVFGSLRLDSVDVDGLRYTALGTSEVESETDFVLPARLDLPWGLAVGHLDIRNIAFYVSEDAEPLLIDSLEVKGRFVDGRLDLKHLSIDMQNFELSGEGSLTARDEYPVNGNWQWRLLIPDYPPLVGETRLDGSLQALDVHQILAPPYSLEADVGLSKLFTGLHFDGEFAVSEFALQTIRPDASELVFDSSVSASGTPDEFAFSAETLITTEGSGALETQIEGRYRPDNLAIDTLLATIRGQPGQLQASGQVELAAPTMIDVQSRWTQLRWPLQGEAILTSQQGQLHVTGQLDAYTLSGDAQLDAPGYTEAQVNFTGQGNRKGLTLPRLDLLTLGGKIGGAAALAWDPQTQASIDMRGQGLNPGVLFEKWTGRLGITIRAEASLADGQINARVDQLHADGVLRDYPMQLQAAGRYATGTTNLESFVLQSGQSELEAHGRIGQTLDLTWSLESTDLSSLSPDAAGRLSANGSTDGPLSKPRLKAVITGDHLVYQEQSIANLAVDADVDLAGKTLSRLELELTDASLAEVVVRSLNVQGSGQPIDHSFSVVADTARGSADIKLDGVLADDSWSYRATQATLTYPRLDAWILRDPALGRVRRKQFELENSCWTSQDATLCAEVVSNAASLETAVTLENLPAAYFASFFPTGLRVEGELSGQASLKRPVDGLLAANLRLQTTRGSLTTLGDNDEPVQLLEFEPGDLRLDLDPEGLRFSAAFPLAGQGLISLNANVGPGAEALMTRPLTGQLTTEVRDVRFASELIPELTRIEGRLAGSAQLAGTLGEPTVTGRIALEDATATLDRAGLTLEDLGIELVGRGSGEIGLNAHARSARGTLDMEGTADLAADPVRANFKVAGTQFKVLDTPEAQLWVTPDLALVLEGKRLDISGEIQIPRGSIEPKQLPKSAATVSPDQVIINQATPSTRPSRYAVNTRIRLIVGDKVDFSGFGLKGRFAGNLVLTDKEDKPTTATGELRILDGNYRAYGQNLSIRTGRLLFAGGPVTEPGLDVEAVRQATADVLVGIRVRGNLKEPNFTLFSDPAMSQSEQLSYLVLGRPLDPGTTTEEQNSMNQAAFGLGLASGALLGDDFGERFGLDDLTVESGPGTTSEQASLLVGKYLSPRLYVSYGLGIFEPISTFRVRYILSSKWSVVGETSATQTGADVFYVIEGGK